MSKSLKKVKISFYVRIVIWNLVAWRRNSE